MVNMEKDLPRNINFGNSNASHNDYEIKIPYKRLDTSIIPFDRTIGRSEQTMTCEKGIANYFNQYEHK